MSDFLNLPIRAVTEDDLFGGAHPELPCSLAICKHGHVFRKGQEFVQFERSYVHTDCLDGMVKTLAPLDFLQLLASHVAHAPSRHNAGTLRQVITGLRRAVGALQLELEQAKADAYAQGSVDTATAIAEAEDEGW